MIEEFMDKKEFSRYKHQEMFEEHLKDHVNGQQNMQNSVA